MTLKSETLEMLEVIASIDNVMKEDGFSEISRNQILKMGNLADNKIANSKETCDQLIGILDEIKAPEPVTQDYLHVVGGICCKIMDEVKSGIKE